MKKFLSFLLLLQYSLVGKAQVNYDFSTATGTFTLLTGDVVAPLVAAYSPTKPLLDESFANNIPIGFSFQYNGINYSTIHLNANGFASLGTPFLSSTTNPSYEINELRSISGLKATIRPILAPFWDNLLLNTANDISYKTTGNAPNRIFTSQWKNMIWQDGTSAITFQLKLYETTNVIEFVYRSEAGSGVAVKSASIGITSENTQIVVADHDSTNFIALINASPRAIVDRITEVETIDVKPRTGQVFRFTPKTCMPPSGLMVQDFTTTTATIKWTPTEGTANYEYAISNIDVQPVAGTVSNLTQLSFSNLSPKTEYFFYIKSACGTVWKKLSFKTSVLATLPYNEGFEDAIDKSMPGTMTTQNSSNAFADIFWQTTNLLTPASGTKTAINGSPFTNSKSWIFTPSFNFIAGRTYELTYKVSATGSAGTLNVKYGQKAGESAMNTTIGTNSNISNTSYSNKIFTFSPSVSGEHTIGFSYESGVNNQLILLDDIALRLIPLPATATNFSVSLTNEKEVKLSWKTLNEDTPSTFIIERSPDGKLFDEIGTLTKTILLPEINEYEYYDRKPLVGVNLYRLKQKTARETIDYTATEIVSVNEDLFVELYPNPSEKEVFVKMKNPETTNIKVYTMTGGELPITTQIMNTYEIKITPNQPLYQGIYLVNIITETETRILKWVVF